MKKINIIKSLEQTLPEIYKYSTLTINDITYSFYEFLENVYINFINENTSLDVAQKGLFDYFNQYIKLASEEALNIVNEFIASNPNFIASINITETETISVSEYLKEMAIKNYNQDGTINYCGKTITIEELYQKILANRYEPFTMDERVELCTDFIRYIDLEILDSIVDGMNITVRDFITKILPTKMISVDKVKINDIEKPIDEVIVETVNHQFELLNQKNQQLEMEYNKTTDMPNLVGEIQVRLNDQQKLEITTEIPTVQSSFLNDEEKNSLLKADLINKNQFDKTYYLTTLNNIKSSIENSTNTHDLDMKEVLFKSIIEKLSDEEKTPQIQALITSIDELIVKKRNNIIKVNNNIEEYTDAFFSELNIMTSKMSNFTTLDEYSNLYGIAVERYQELLDKQINDLQLHSAFQLLFRRIEEKRLNLDATIGYQSVEVERAKVKLNAMFSQIQQDLLTIEHDSNNLGNLTGTEIRLNLNIETAREEIENAYKQELLTVDDREYFMNRLKGFSVALQSEKKIGYGLR